MNLILKNGNDVFILDFKLRMCKKFKSQVSFTAISKWGSNTDNKTDYKHIDSMTYIL
jgi:hypothetical protein